MKRLLTILVCLLLSGAIVFGLPLLVKEEKVAENRDNEESIIPQKILSYGEKEHTYYKLYNSGKLVGVITDKEEIDKAIDEEYRKYEESFPDTGLDFKEDLYLAKETSYIEFEDVDEEIIDYLLKNELLGVETTAVEFSTNEGVYDIIYVQDPDDFYAARDAFILNFISEDTLNTLRNNEEIADPVDFGTIEKSIQIREKITMDDAVASPEDIFTSEEEIFDYLCYGRNEERQYYTVQEGDTLRSVGYYFGDMSPRQIVMLNRGTLSSVDDVLKAGTELNITYYTSPITITVIKERLTQEAVTPPSPIYKEDDSLAAGKTEVVTPEISGLNNILYEETWVNGVLQGGTVKSTYTVREPVQGVIALGTMPVVTTGSGNFGYPVDSPMITCRIGCYYGHNGTDFQSRYDRWGNIYAVDSGVVERQSYDGLSGNYVVINHNNGYWTWYGHASQFYVSVGDSVERGQVIGQIGMTGYATGPHVHLSMFYGCAQWSCMIDACSVMNCAGLDG